MTFDGVVDYLLAEIDVLRAERESLSLRIDVLLDFQQTLEAAGDKLAHEYEQSYLDDAYDRARRGEALTGWREAWRG